MSWKYKLAKVPYKARSIDNMFEIRCEGKFASYKVIRSESYTFRNVMLKYRVLLFLFQLNSIDLTRATLDFATRVVLSNRKRIKIRIQVEEHPGKKSYISTYTKATMCRLE